jgi:hypothetical protein
MENATNALAAEREWRCCRGRTNLFWRTLRTAEDPSMAEQISDLAGLAEKYCLVSRSVSCPVHYHLSVEISEE